MNERIGADAWRTPVRDWGEPKPLWYGQALIDLHNGKGTAWKKDRYGRYYPDCDCHRPPEVQR